MYTDIAVTSALMWNSAQKLMQEESKKGKKLRHKQGGDGQWTHFKVGSFSAVTLKPKTAASIF